MPSRSSKPSSGSSRPSVPEAELEVLSHLVDMGEAEASELRHRLSDTRPLSHASVVTLLQRLVLRGLVARHKAETGKAFVYHPTRRGSTAIGRAAQRFVERVFHNDAVSMVSSLFGAKTPTENELRELRQLLRELERKDAGGDDA